MKKFLLAGILFFVLQAASAQKIYFIYIQSDNNTPFFVKMGDKVVSSTVSGYLIVPKLVDSVYQFTVGKTGQAAAESRFSVTIAKKDRGFLLREAEEKMSLFDLQSLTLLPAVAAASSGGESVAKRTDAFTVLLSQAANDPSLLEIRTATPVMQNSAEKKTEATQAVVMTSKTSEKEETTPRATNADTTNQRAAENTTAVATPELLKTETSDDQKDKENVQPQKDAVQETVVLIEPPSSNEASAIVETYKPSVVTRRSESSTSEGFGLVFLDQTEDATDTIRILIPNQNLSFKREETDDEDSKKFLNISSTDTIKTTVSVEAANEKISAAKKRTSCNTAVSEKEFLKLRKNMSAKKSEEAMISEAQKAFKKGCFSTDQIKSLSALFLSASGKYQFFDAAYGHVSDKQQYALLQTELNDAYYVNRFKALIANQ